MLERVTLGEGDRKTEVDNLKWRVDGKELLYTLTDHKNDTGVDTYLSSANSWALRPVFEHNNAAGGKVHINVAYTTGPLAGATVKVIISDINHAYKESKDSFDLNSDAGAAGCVHKCDRSDLSCQHR